MPSSKHVRKETEKEGPHGEVLRETSVILGGPKEMEEGLKFSIQIWKKEVLQSGGEKNPE